VKVDLVLVHTSVTDKNGHFIGGLEREKFSLYEDGVAQEIALFSQEDVPISLGIVLDTSGSMRRKFNTVINAALAFIRASNSQDEVFLIGFNDEVELLEDYTSDIDAISDTLDNTIVTGGTALYDAIFLGVQKGQEGEKPKKAIIVITDGEDKDSYYDLEELVDKVQESDVQIYNVGFLRPMREKGLFGRFRKTPVAKARDGLKLISDETGAKAFFPEDIDAIHGIVEEIAVELRNQYSIGYISANKVRDGSWRRIKILLDGSKDAGLYVRHRRGYYSPKETSN
jgi:Ca-activated chloride channel family protein